jgi:hypothetical protein
MGAIPTLQEILEEYRRFNTWELEEQERVLSRSSVEEGQTQFLEQCDLARTLAPDTAIAFFEQYTPYWIARRKKLGRVVEAVDKTQTARGGVETEQMTGRTHEH